MDPRRATGQSAEPPYLVDEVLVQPLLRLVRILRGLSTPFLGAVVLCQELSEVELAVSRAHGYHCGRRTEQVGRVWDLNGDRSGRHEGCVGQ